MVWILKVLMNFLGQYKHNHSAIRICLPLRFLKVALPAKLAYNGSSCAGPAAGELQADRER